MNPAELRAEVERAGAALEAAEEAEEAARARYVRAQARTLTAWTVYREAGAAAEAADAYGHWTAAELDAAAVLPRPDDVRAAYAPPAVIAEAEAIARAAAEGEA